MDGFKNTTRMKYMTGGPVKKAMGGTVPATAATTARPTTTAAPATSNLGPITRENLAARKAANTAAKAARGNITGTAAAAAAPKLGPITRENLAARKAANTAAKAARGNTTGMAKGGVIKKGNGGGVFNEKGKRATWAEIAAEGRRMEGRKPPVEGISTRPTDSSGRRMTDKELGMVTTAKKTMKKAIGGGVDAKLSRSITNAKAQQDRMAAAPSFDPSKPSSGSGSMSKLLGLAGKTVAPPARGPSMASPHSNRPMIRRKAGGLAVMPKGKC